MNMNKEIDYSIKEIFFMTKAWWKKLVLFALAGVIVFSAYGFLSIKSGQSVENPAATGEQNAIQNDLEIYDSYQNNKESATSKLKKEWADLYADHSGNPIYTVDPYRCEYEQLVLRFDDANHDDNVVNWIMKADDQKLFGDAADRLALYKSTLIITPVRTSDYLEAKDTTVQLIKVDGFDVEQAAEYLKGFFMAQSKKDDLEIKGLSESKAEGYNANVATYQKNGREALTSVYNALDKANNVGAFLSKPVTNEEEKASGLKDLIKYVLGGIIFGLLIGIAVMAFSTIRKNCIISRRQIEEGYGLEMLADFSKDKDLSLDVLNANLDLMTGENSEIMIISLPVEDGERNPAEQWNEKSKRHYSQGYDLSNDPETIDALQDKDGIVLCLRLGVSKPEDIHRTVLRAQILKKEVLGYVIL